MPAAITCATLLPCASQAVRAAAATSSPLRLSCRWSAQITHRAAKDSSVLFAVCALELVCVVPDFKSSGTSTSTGITRLTPNTPLHKPCSYGSHLTRESRAMKKRLTFADLSAARIFSPASEV